MRPVLQHGIPLLEQGLASGTQTRNAIGTLPSLRSLPRTEAWTCLKCQTGTWRSFSYALSSSARLSRPLHSNLRRRDLATTASRNADRPQALADTTPSEKFAQAQEAERIALDKVEAATTGTSQDQLPSHRESQRWQMSKRTQRIMDDILAKAAIAGQHVNNYTGTDYSGIQALRQAIIEQGTQSILV